MKNKKIVLNIFLFLIGISFISSVRAEQQTLLPNQYWGLGETMSFADTLNFQISSNIGINVYIMDSYQPAIYQSDPQDTASGYYKEWMGILLLTNSFIAPEDRMYYVLMINPSDSSSTTVSVSASIDYYQPPEPEKEYIYIDVVSYDYTGWWILIGYGIVSFIGIVFLIRKLTNKKLREGSQPISIPQMQQPKKEFRHCSSCGTEILDKTVGYCSKCGASLK